jgi:hypothetical protein
MSIDELFTKDALEKYIEELSKEYKKTSGSEKISKLILVGGAAILLNYNFRKTTNDIDAVIYSSNEILSAIDKIAVKNKLPYDWINTNFENSPSYSERLDEVSKYYKTFNNKLEVRLIEGEYLIAMKLVAGRIYKHDMSDISGILMEHKNNGKEIKKEDIDKAIKQLYGSWDKIPEKSKILINEIFDNGNYEKMYQKNKEYEEETRKLILEFNNEYPKVLTFGEIDNIIEKIREKENKIREDE